MTEITITDDHKLPHGYWYEKPVPEGVRHLKSDQEIIEELKGTMPLSEIAKICDAPEQPKYESELKAKVDVLRYNDYLTVIVYPCLVDKEPIKREYEVSDLLTKKQRNQLAYEKLKEIIYK